MLAPAASTARIAALRSTSSAVGRSALLRSHSTPSCVIPLFRRSFASLQQDISSAEPIARRRDDSVDGLFEGLLEGDRYALARAITLVESTTSKHRAQAQELLSKILEREAALASEQSTTLASVGPLKGGDGETSETIPLKRIASLSSDKNQKRLTGNAAMAAAASATSSSSSSSSSSNTATSQESPAIRLGKSFRIGLSGPPGVGKSTFIEAFGMYLVSLGHKVSVLAVDPSSARTGGSILGDKTRMTELSRDDNAYVRPSPSRGTLAAGYDICLVETVGVGQSETMVADIVDMFVLLVPPAGGDELQGMKKGIMELSDLVIVNKSDGALVDSARYAQIEYTSALKFVKAITEHWKARVIRVSSMGGPETGIQNAWETMKEYFDIMESTGELQKKRGEQRQIWMWRQVKSELMDLLNEDTQVRSMSKELEVKVLRNEMMSGAAAHLIVEKFMKSMTAS
ncbi:hypothetical protein BGW38_001988 [Lunasporangiospora selenospora]|uniref:LAO/AO transport system kinase n=1 Tax=Lunasporangiospora selenospora TaxID=979761 RepID=A0A9P6FTD4_9FUNG|nr:hypothetical protein BGW38_001988 [Lunasporangiospora selenospora]